MGLPELPIGLFEAEADGRVTAANSAFAALVADAAGSVIGIASWANADPTDRARAEHQWRQGIDRGGRIACEFRVWQSTGATVHVHLDATPMLDNFGTLVGYSGYAFDQSATVAHQQLLEQMLTVVGGSGASVIILDRAGVPVYTNESAQALLGVTSADEMAREPSIRGLLQSIRDQVPREVMNSSTSSTWAGEIGFRNADGFERSLEVDLVLQRTADGVIDFWGGVIRDATATKQEKAELARLATHDPLTSLPNRALLLRKAADALERSRAEHTGVAILFIDVDRLKDVNDTVGHELGDALLTQVASRLAHATRPSDIVARIGGDEFVVLCDGAIDQHTALELAERIRLSLTGKLMIGGVEIDMTVSVGVAVNDPEHLEGISSHDGALELLRSADTAMYVAKRRGRARSELYTDAMRAENRDTKQLSNELERALAANELRLAYQPILSTHSGRVVGAEALLRWDHPVRGALLPAQFVHLAEESGAIVPIGDWVIRQACQDARAWMDAGLVDRKFSVHVNVSSRQLVEGAFVERVLATMRQLELNPAQLTLDFDEDTLYDDQGGNRRAMQALRRFGVQLALDSFGTGTSSLTALRTCGADVLKLDGVVARTLGAGSDDEDPIVRAIIQLAHALDMQVVAEWVTTADQLHRLRMLGCDMVQGYLLGEPTDADLFASKRPHRSAPT